MSRLRVWRAWLLAGLLFVLLVEIPGRLVYSAVRSHRLTKAMLDNVHPEELREALSADFLAPGTRIRYDYDMFLGWRAQPNQRGRTYRINGEGRRDNVEYSTVKTPRVFLAGGSAAWSWGVTDNQHTLSAELTRLIAAQPEVPARTVVLNMAEQAYGLRQESSFVLEHIAWRPRLVVSYDGVNDLQTIFLGKDPARVRTWGLFPDILAESLAQTTASSFVVTSEQLTNGSPVLWAWRTFRAGLNRLSGRSSPKPRTLTPDEAARIRSFFREELTRQHRVLEALGVKTLFVLQPIGYVDKPVHRDETALRSGAEWWRQAYGVLEEEYLALNSRDGIETLSLAHVFKNETRAVYLDPVHVNELGIRLIAQALSPKLAENLAQNESRHQRPAGEWEAAVAANQP